MDMVMEDMSNGTRADQFDTRGNRAGELSIEGKVLERHL